VLERPPFTVAPVVNLPDKPSRGLSGQLGLAALALAAAETTAGLIRKTKSKERRRHRQRLITEKAVDDNWYVVNFEERKSDLSINEFGTYEVSSKEAGRLP
jgi:hypothetical protein